MPSDPFNQPTGTQAPAASGRERRRDPRYTLIAEAPVIASASALALSSTCSSPNSASAAALSIS